MLSLTNMFFLFPKDSSLFTIKYIEKNIKNQYKVLGLDLIICQVDGLHGSPV